MRRRRWEHRRAELLDRLKSRVDLVEGIREAADLAQSRFYFANALDDLLDALYSLSEHRI